MAFITDSNGKSKGRGGNMSRSTYSKIETGARNIRISDFIALKMIDDVDFSEFFVGLLLDEQ